MNRKQLSRESCHAGNPCDTPLDQSKRSLSVYKSTTLFHFPQTLPSSSLSLTRQTICSWDSRVRVCTSFSSFPIAKSLRLSLRSRRWVLMPEVPRREAEASPRRRSRCRGRRRLVSSFRWVVSRGSWRPASTPSAWAPELRSISPPFSSISPPRYVSVFLFFIFSFFLISCFFFFLGFALRLLSVRVSDIRFRCVL